MKALLLSAGLGTRLKPFTNHKPKALAEVNNKTLLERNIRYLSKYGINDIIVNVHHFADMIEDYITTHNGFESNITISDEKNEVLETGGGLKKAASYFDGEEDFIVMNVDVLTNLDLAKMVNYHLQNSCLGTLAVLNRNSSRQFMFNTEMDLCGWINHATGEKRISKASEPYTLFAFSGIQVLSQSLLNLIPFEGKFSLVDVYLYLAKTQIIKGYDHTGNLFMDVGKPGSIALAEQYFQ